MKLLSILFAAVLFSLSPAMAQEGCVDQAAIEKKADGFIADKTFKAVIIFRYEPEEAKAKKDFALIIMTDPDKASLLFFHEGCYVTGQDDVRMSDELIGILGESEVVYEKGDGKAFLKGGGRGA